MAHRRAYRPVDNVDNKHYVRFNEHINYFMYQGFCPMCMNNNRVRVLDERHHIDAERFHVFKYFCYKHKLLFLRVDFLAHPDNDPTKPLVIMTNYLACPENDFMKKFWEEDVIGDLPAMEQMD